MFPTNLESPEMWLQLYAMRNAEDIARAERSRMPRTLREKQPRSRRWSSVFRFGAHRSQHLPPTSTTFRRLT